MIGRSVEEGMVIGRIGDRSVEEVKCLGNEIVY